MEYKGLDKINQKLLSLLIEDSRISYAEMARQTHLSRVAVRERINNMIEEGIISRFTTVVAAEKVGYPLAVFLEITVEPHLLEKIAEQLGTKERIKVVYQLTGAATLHVQAFLENPDALAKFLQKEVYPIEGIKNVESYMLLKKFKSDLTVR